MLDFVYENQTRMIFGRNALDQVGEQMKKLGQRVLVVTYGDGFFARIGLLDRVYGSLEQAGLTVYRITSVEANPKMGVAYEGIRLCKQEKIDALLAIGGGSVIDTCKTIGMGACYDGDAWDFFTGTQATTTLPVGVILTIPAAGSESSMDAVMTLEKGELKRASCAAPFIRPAFAIQDPQLTYTLPPYQTACGACDIIAHTLERYFTRTPAVEVTDRLCEGLILAVMSAVKKALATPDDYDARAELMLAGSYAHNNMVGVGRVQDWASHGLGHEISALKGTAHGATLAVMMPAWMKYVYKTDVPRFAQFANRVMGVPYIPGGEAEMAKEGVNRFQQFIHSIGLPTTLEQLGVTAEEIPLLSAKCHRAGSFVPLDEEKIAEVYHIAMKNELL